MNYLIIIGILIILIISGCEVPVEEVIEIQQEIEVKEEIIEEVKDIISNTSTPLLKINDTEDNIIRSSKLHYMQLPITYYITNEDDLGRFDTIICGDYEVRRITRAFQEIENATDGVVSFKKVNTAKNANIEITCSFLEDCYLYESWSEGDYEYVSESICAHTRGLALISEIKNNVILKAEIELIGLADFAETNSNERMSGFYVGTCGHLNTEVHEILHVFGYKHVNDPNSIMYYESESSSYVLRQQSGECISRKEIDTNIINDLKSIYGK